MSFFSAAPALPNSSGPLYVQLGRHLRDAILDGRLNDADALPPERELSKLYGVSRLTVRKSLALLQDEGLLICRHGSGSYVAPRSQLQHLGPAFRDDSAAYDKSARTLWLSQAAACVTSDESMALGVAPGTKIYRFSRLRYRDATPVGIEHTVVLSACLPSEKIHGDSIYAAMQEYGNGPTRALQRFRAVLLEGADAERLEVAPGSAGLFIERRGYFKNGQTAEVTRAWYRGDASDLIAEVIVPDLTQESRESSFFNFVAAM